MWIAARERLADEDASRRADRLQPTFGGKVEGAVELREDVVCEREDARETDVDPRRREPLAPEHDLGLPGEEPCDVDAVAAEVHECAAVELGAQPHVVGILERRRERRSQLPELADPA